ncbi:hypothetical protein [Candidatus Halobonum tyrrellensis]|uniref:CHAT domain-containing protein n=1 Tax=Candidatus Halobonum tyrrellensis G22 TaxID=1324957 RepID=V4HND1_9EURY|nr:hypothetical protein [Candidatus Halobonum tyrrellensis]ESP89424.1 hypothetical protein K933_04311 [Candidatus Halobonum tyrrellensis G22]
MRDDIEDAVLRLDADGPRASASADAFTFPVESACRVRTDRVAFYQSFVLCVHEGGDLVETTAPDETVDLGPGTYEFQVTAAPMKLYLRAEGPLRVVDDGRRTELSFDGDRDVSVGARSFHIRPAGTVTVPETPRGLMRAVSTFGSALATTSPERSFPTLRGHPPLVAFGDEVAVPEFAEPPDTGVEVVVPDRWNDVYTVATLAYYLGATVVPGDEPAVCAAGRSYPLDADPLFESVQRLLEHAFLLDCVVRTEGFYDVDLHERAAVERRVDIDPERLYDLPLDERLAAYFDVPVDPLSDLVGWHLTADVEPTPESAELLPFVVNDMASVRDPSTVDHGDSAAGDDSIESFFRAGSDADGGAGANERVVSPARTDTSGHVWVGDGYPTGASKPTVDAYRHRLDQRASDSAVIDVTVVCNEASMREETERLYGFRDHLEFDIDVELDRSTDELRALLAEEHDLFHFVGHVDPEGMKCPDGHLDLHTLESTGAKAFFLNACSSYDQGMQLVRAGAIGGLVTTSDVGNIMATNVGRTMARLLDYGFDLHGVLDVAKRVHVVGGSYSVVGDAGVTLCQANSGTPTALVVNTHDQPAPDVVEFDHAVYTTRNFGVGSLLADWFEEDGTQYVVGGVTPHHRVSREQFEEVSEGRRYPLLVDLELRWSDELDFDSL